MRRASRPAITAGFAGRSGKFCRDGLFVPVRDGFRHAAGPGKTDRPTLQELPHRAGTTARCGPRCAG